MMFYCGLVGNPIQHSCSPEIHSRFAAQFKHQFEYQLYELLSEDLADFFAKFRGYGTGLNITYPYKQKVLEFLDHNKYNQENINVINNSNNQLIGCCVDG